MIAVRICVTLLYVFDFDVYACASANVLYGNYVSTYRLLSMRVHGPFLQSSDRFRMKKFLCYPSFPKFFSVNGDFMNISMSR